jgi:hypothetical protein
MQILLTPGLTDNLPRTRVGDFRTDSTLLKHPALQRMTLLKSLEAVSNYRAKMLRGPFKRGPKILIDLKRTVCLNR